MSEIWNPWHGCRRESEGCLHCYVYRRDESFGGDASEVRKTRMFDLPLQKKRSGEYKLPSGTHVFACMTSDFFLEEADEWRAEAWAMMRVRSDLSFTVITKRIRRVAECLPPDWGDGYENVELCCTAECQRTANERLPVFASLPFCRRSVICEPLLEEVTLLPYLNGISCVVAGGESGANARVCDHAWILSLRAQCAEAGVEFYFKQTGARFRKDGKIYEIPRSLQFSQARKAHADYQPSARI